MKHRNTLFAVALLVLGAAHAADAQVVKGPKPEARKDRLENSRAS